MTGHSRGLGDARTVRHALPELEAGSGERQGVPRWLPAAGGGRGCLGWHELLAWPGGGAPPLTLTTPSLTLLTTALLQTTADRHAECQAALERKAQLYAKLGKQQ